MNFITKPRAPQPLPKPIPTEDKRNGMTYEQLTAVERHRAAKRDNGQHSYGEERIGHPKDKPDALTAQFNALPNGKINFAAAAEVWDNISDHAIRQRLDRMVTKGLLTVTIHNKRKVWFKP
ncbi:MAG: hypothetical protein U5N55_05115 [Cypionkella sp.]|nr:hypothetical protein [Cypionkella sp.]